VRFTLKSYFFYYKPLRTASRPRLCRVTQAFTSPWSAPSSSHPGQSRSVGERADSKAGRSSHPSNMMQGFSHLPSEGKKSHI